MKRQKSNVRRRCPFTQRKCKQWQTLFNWKIFSIIKMKKKQTSYQHEVSVLHCNILFELLSKKPLNMQKKNKTFFIVYKKEFIFGINNVSKQ